MLALNLAWNLWFVQMTDQTEDHHDNPAPPDHADRWIWGVWIVVALLSVAVLPFASRFREVAVAIASFCGVTL